MTTINHGRDSTTREAMAICGIADGTGTLGIVARQARRDHPDASAAELAAIIREIWQAATDDWAAERIDDCE